MAIMDYTTFKTKYQSGYGLTTSTMLYDAYRTYAISGTLPTGQAVETVEEVVPEEEAVTPTTTTPTTPVPTTPTAPIAPALTPVTPLALAPMPAVTPAPSVEAPVVPTMPGVTPAPEVPAIEVTPAPAYEISAAQLAFEEMYGEKLTDWVLNPQGIPEDTKGLMIQKQTDMLKAREVESLRTMKINMERRGITNSGYIDAYAANIHAATSVTLAGAISDIQIQSEMMKIASFEKAMGTASQFLGYLSEQSQLKYTPGFATWQAQTNANLTQYQAQIEISVAEWQMESQFAITNWQAQTQALFSQWEVNANNMVAQWQTENQFNLTEWSSRAEYDMALFGIESQLNLAMWQGQMDLYKLELNNAYQTENTILQGQIQTELTNLQHLHNLELTEMELEAAENAAAAQGFGNLIGTIIGAIFGK